MFGKLLIGAAALAVFAVATPASADGKKAFTDAKCQKCHSIQAAGVEKGIGGKMAKGPDLSGTGLGEGRDAAWFGKFLNKEVEMKSNYSDKKIKHKKKWKGSDADLKAITEMLAAQKTKVDVKDPAADKEDDE